MKWLDMVAGNGKKLGSYITYRYRPNLFSGLTQKGQQWGRSLLLDNFSKNDKVYFWFNANVWQSPSEEHFHVAMKFKINVWFLFLGV